MQQRASILALCAISLAKNAAHAVSCGQSFALRELAGVIQGAATLDSVVNGIKLRRMAIPNRRLNQGFFRR